MSVPSLDGKTFVDVTEEHAGDVGGDTRFDYHQTGDLIWARYSGGAVRLGFLVGKRTGDSLHFRYSHLTTAGETASGRCDSELSVTAEGLIESHESWSWESKPGTGTSIVREVAS